MVKLLPCGRIKGDIKIGDKIYKISSKHLNKSIKDSFSKEIIKRSLNCNISIKENKPIIIKVFDEKIKFDLKSNLIPDKAITSPITKERIITQFTKTGNTPYEFKNINIELDENITIPISSINELRRNCLDAYENKFKISLLKSSSINFNFKDSNINNTISKDKKVSVLLNKINNNFDYTKLINIDNIYLPFKYFLNPENEATILKIISINNINTYILLPTIIKDNYKNLINNNLNKILEKFKIKRHYYF